MKYIIFAAALILIILILIFPGAAKESASDAADMWFTILVPSLMPYSAAASIMAKTGVLSRLSSPLDKPMRKLLGFSGSFSYVFITSLLSGYPNGAHLCGELYSLGVISSAEASYMINAASLCGPSFIICAVAAGMLGDISLSKYIIIPHILSALIIAVLNGKKGKFIPMRPQFCYENPTNAWEIITDSIASASLSMLNILGFTVILTVISGLITHIFSGFFGIHPLISAIFTGIIEMTGGCSLASQLDIYTALSVVSFCVSFGGLSVICQIVSAARMHKIKTQHLIPSKLLQGILSTALTLLYLYVDPPAVTAFVYTENTADIGIAPVIISAVISFIVLIYKNLRNKAYRKQ